MAYHFPPRGGGGVLRALKFAKYLPEFGWIPTVVTADPAVYEQEILDPELERETETMDVRRSWHPGPWAHFSASRPPARTPAGRRATGTLKRALANRILPYLEVPWVIPAFRALRRAHALAPADAVVTTSPPGWSHLVGAMARRRLGIPWVMDFRDQWAGNPVHAYSAWRRHGALDRWLERSWLLTADAVVTATPAITAHYRRLSGRGTVETITNGYDAEDFRDIERVSPERFTVTYVGTLGPEYDPTPFLAAWRAFLSRCSLDETRAECRFVGHRSRMDFSRAGAGDDLLRRTVRFEDFVSHREALREMARSSVLLLLLSHDTMALTSKLFEYLGAEKPILAVAPPGELRTFLADRHLGAGFAPEDQAGIVGELERLHDRHQRGDLASVEPRALAAFERRALTGTLAAVLDRVAQR